MRGYGRRGLNRARASACRLFALRAANHPPAKRFDGDADGRNADGEDKRGQTLQKICGHFTRLLSKSPAERPNLCVSTASCTVWISIRKCFYQEKILIDG